MEKASYILERTGWKGRTADAIIQCMDEGHGTLTKPALHRSTVWRRLEKLAPLKPADWRAVSTLVQICCDSQGSLERIALRCGWDTSTVRARSSKLVGPLFKLRQDLVGWKWMLEAVLRRARFVGEAYPEGPWQISAANDSAG